MSNCGVLYIIPSPIGENIHSFFYDDYYIESLKKIRTFIVEDARTTRRFLKKIIPNFPINECSFLLYNEHTQINSLMEYISPLLKGQDVAIMSEAGCPAIADPGYPIIFEAHKHNIRIIPLIGPSSILLALMASGLPAQSFKFNGYLPAKTNELIKAIHKIEKQSLHENLTQIFMETPYRNNSIFHAILKTCKPKTFLTVASNITQPSEFIKTQTIENWQKNCTSIQNVPTIFILYSGKL